MEKSKVYYSNLRCKPGVNLLKKLRNLIKAAGIEQIDFKDQYTAVKLHFGEPGNMAYIRPNYVATVVDLLNSLGAKTFLTDANTLYKGRRDNAVDHLHSAMVNGFNPIAVNANVIIADGLKGTNYAAIPIEGAKYCPAPKIGQAVADADIIIFAKIARTTKRSVESATNLNPSILLLVFSLDKISFSISLFRSSNCCTILPP